MRRMRRWWLRVVARGDYPAAVRTPEGKLRIADRRRWRRQVMLTVVIVMAGTLLGDAIPLVVVVVLLPVWMIVMAAYVIWRRRRNKRLTGHANLRPGSFDGTSQETER